jgi:hypothetical protein
MASAPNHKVQIKIINEVFWLIWRLRLQNACAVHHV